MKISFDVVELLDFFSLQYTIAKRKYKQKLSDDDDEERKRKEKKKKKRRWRWWGMEGSGVFIIKEDDVSTLFHKT